MNFIEHVNALPQDLLPVRTGSLRTLNNAPSTSVAVPSQPFVKLRKKFASSAMC